MNEFLNGLFFFFILGVAGLMMLLKAIHNAVPGNNSQEKFRRGVEIGQQIGGLFRK